MGSLWSYRVQLACEPQFPLTAYGMTPSATALRAVAPSHTKYSDAYSDNHHAKAAVEEPKKYLLRSRDALEHKTNRAEDESPDCYAHSALHEKYSVLGSILREANGARDPTLPGPCKRCGLQPDRLSQ